METMLLFAVLSGTVLLSVFRHRCLFSTRIVSLAVVMALSGCFATTNLLAQETSGDIGNITWDYDSVSRKLTIGGMGHMGGFDDYYGNRKDRPWDDFAGDIKKVIIGDNVQSIGACAFSECINIDSVCVLGDTLEYIGDCAFEECIKLTYINFPSSMWWIRDNAFEGCISLKSIVLNCNVVGSSAFRECTELEFVCFGSEVSEIEEFAFYNCENLKFIEFEDDGLGLSIESYAFGGNRPLSSLEELRIPKRLEYIGINAFADFYRDEYRSITKLYYDAIDCDEESACPGWNVYNVILGKDVISIHSGLFSGSSLYGGIEIPDSSALKSIGSYAFSKTSLSSIFLPETVESIGEYAFSESKLGDTVVLPQNISCIEDGVFFNTEIEAVCLPNTLKSIGDYAFRNTCIKSIAFPDGLQCIGDYAFAGNSALESIGHLPYALEELGIGAFLDCAKLRGDIVIPDGVSRIETWTFQGCLMLTGMSLPAAITRIGSAAFENCVNLKEMSVYTLDPPTVGRDEFENLNCTLKVPCMGAAIYKIADGWDYFEDNIVEISPYRLIVVSNNDVYGSVQVTTPATCESDIVTVSAVPAPQCHFVCWRNRAGDNLSEANPYVFTITSDLTLIAEFRSDADTAVLYTVDYEPNPAGGRISVECEGETVNPGDRLESGSILELRAIANEGYDFVKWWDGETKASRDYYLDENLEISATFRKDSQDTTGGLCVVEFNPEPAGGRIMVECEGEKVNPGDRLASGSFLELRAIADEGYRFVEWWDGETKARRDYELEEDVEISALFQKETAVENMQSEFCRIWPNPTEGRFYVELGTAAGMDVLSANGMIVRPLMELPAGRHEIDLDGQASGVYFLRLTSSQENRVFKILLQR